MSRGLGLSYVDGIGEPLVALEKSIEDGVDLVGGGVEAVSFAERAAAVVRRCLEMQPWQNRCVQERTTGMLSVEADRAAASKGTWGGWESG